MMLGLVRTGVKLGLVVFAVMGLSQNTFIEPKVAASGTVLDGRDGREVQVTRVVRPVISGQALHFLRLYARLSHRVADGADEAGMLDLLAHELGLKDTRVVPGQRGLQARSTGMDIALLIYALERDFPGSVLTAAKKTAAPGIASDGGLILTSARCRLWAAPRTCRPGAARGKPLIAVIVPTRRDDLALVSAAPTLLALARASLEGRDAFVIQVQPDASATLRQPLRIELV